MINSQIRFIQFLSLYGQRQSSVIKKNAWKQHWKQSSCQEKFCFSILLKGVKSSQSHSAENDIGNQQMTLKN